MDEAPVRPQPCWCIQVHSEDLAAVLGIVMAHQAPALKSALVLRLMSALVLPDPEHYRAHLRRLAALEGASAAERGTC